MVRIFDRNRELINSGDISKVALEAHRNMDCFLLNRRPASAGLMKEKYTRRKYTQQQAINYRPFF